MSNRTLVELNHDYCPLDKDSQAWAEQMQSYMRSGNPADLPRGVTWKDYRHHSDPEPTRDGLLLDALVDALAPILSAKSATGADGVTRFWISNATRKKAEVLAREALAVVRRIEA